MRLSSMFDWQRKALTPAQVHAAMMDAARRYSSAATDYDRRVAFADWTAGFASIHPDYRQAAMDKWADTYLPKAAPAAPPAPVDPNLEPDLAKRDAAHQAEFGRSFNEFVRRQPDPLGSLGAQGVPTRPATTTPITQGGGSPGAKRNGVMVAHPHGREPAPPPSTVFARPVELPPSNPVPWRPAPSALGRAGGSDGVARQPWEQP